MLKRVLVPALIVSLAGLAWAEPEKNTPKKDKPAVPATPIVKPKDASQPAEKAKKPEPTLVVGSKAPAITATEWLKGKEVKSFEKGKVYVVEFWATWCGPCLKSIPHLTELQRKHKDVTIIGMASSERKPKDGSDTRLDTLKKFVNEQGDKMDYTVAYDADRTMSEAWMKPAGQGGIPCAFVVDGEGKIAYIGHPMAEGFEKTIASLTGGKHDEGKKDDHAKDKPADGKNKDQQPAKKK